MAVLILIVVLGGSAPGFKPSRAAQAAGTTIKWHDALRQKAEWYRSSEADRIADNLIVYQRHSGGWPKNIDMATVLTEPELAAIAKEKDAPDSTIDNGATYTQLVYLARVFIAGGSTRYRDSFLDGIDYLLKAQYDNGGWPQYYPLKEGYYTHITFNDDAMVGALKLLRDVGRKQPEYAFVDDGRRAR